MMMMMIGMIHTKRDEKRWQASKHKQIFRHYQYRRRNRIWPVKRWDSWRKEKDRGDTTTDLTKHKKTQEKSIFSHRSEGGESVRTALATTNHPAVVTWPVKEFHVSSTMPLMIPETNFACQKKPSVHYVFCSSEMGIPVTYVLLTGVFLYRSCVFFPSPCDREPKRNFIHELSVPARTTNNAE